MSQASQAGPLLASQTPAAPAHLGVGGVEAVHEGAHVALGPLQVGLSPMR